MVILKKKNSITVGFVNLYHIEGIHRCLSDNWNASAWLDALASMESMWHDSNFRVMVF